MEMQAMSITVAGVVKNGVVVPKAPLPEGAHVEIHLNDNSPAVSPGLPEGSAAGQHASSYASGMSTKGESVPAARLTPGELRRMPREQRQAILAAAAEMAEADYRSDKELTGFDAFSEEELDDDESDSR
jgi:hypothetical protein